MNGVNWGDFDGSSQAVERGTVRQTRRALVTSAVGGAGVLLAACGAQSMGGEAVAGGAASATARRATVTWLFWGTQEFADLLVKAQDAFMKEYRAKYPDRSELQPRNDETYAAPQRYNSTDDHFRNFFDAVRARRPGVEDAAFGLRAAGPALLANHSYFENRPIGWDAEKMTRTSIESH